MKIYTKTGDTGETGLFGGRRVKKDDPRVRTYGDVDELNALIGLARSLKSPDPTDSELRKIQNDLFHIGAVLAAPDKGGLEGRAAGFVGPDDVTFLEKAIDRMEADLKPLRHFLLPGGGDLGARLHLARAVCRRTERSIVAFAGTEMVGDEILMYVNRLSDYLFVLARWVNARQGIAEEAWEKK